MVDPLWGRYAAGACPHFVAECMDIVRADREIAEHVEAACATGDIQIVHEAVFQAVDMFVSVLCRREALVRRYFPSLSRYHLSLEPRGISLVSPDGDVKPVWHQEEDEAFVNHPNTGSG